MKDSFGRNINYLRISVTDKCNLRCGYCMPKEGVNCIPHEEILTLEEIYRVVKIMEGLGVRRIRITGGEPLVRKNIVKLIDDIHRGCEGIKEIAMTTNGVLLGDMAEQLINGGLESVNISLDTLEADNFKRITGRDEFARVMESIEVAKKMNFKLKINCVPSRQLNETEIEAIAGLAKANAIDVRFIELMPIGCGSQYEGIPSDENFKNLEKFYGKPKASEKERLNGPARYYEFEGFKGRIGFISPMSHSFCHECNRVRLTAEGRLKLCLHYNDGIELKPLLRGGLSDEEIRLEIENAILDKPLAHNFLRDKEKGSEEDKRKMVQIGG